MALRQVSKLVLRNRAFSTAHRLYCSGAGVPKAVVPIKWKWAHDFGPPGVLIIRPQTSGVYDFAEEAQYPQGEVEQRRYYIMIAFAGFFLLYTFADFAVWFMWMLNRGEMYRVGAYRREYAATNAAKKQAVIDAGLTV